MTFSSDAPFQRIALSLSGGGYRAAAFHLGTLDLLQRLGLLQNVTAVSTVSGGSICGARYAVSLLRNEAFDTFFDDFSRSLVRTNVVSSAVTALKAPARGGRRRTLINAAADAYATPGLLGGVRLGELMGAETHVREWIFNATEFHGGAAFRFHVGTGSGGRIGNGHHHLSRALAARARLADVVAASSCFPGAFEPIVLPTDFVWPEDGAQDEAWANGRSSAFPSELPLMDGGIHDNQGIESLLLANERAVPKEAFDLFIVSDTHRSGAALLEVDASGTARGPRLRHLLHAGEAFVAVCGLAGAALAFDTARAWSLRGFEPLDLLARVLPMLLAFGLAGGLPTAWERLKAEVRRQIPEMSGPLWSTLGELRLGELVEMLNVRVRSVLAMTADVFMKRVRALSYERLYRAVGARKLNVSNLIYDLERAAQSPRDGLQPTEAQVEVARVAGSVRTALWFDRGEEELRALVACAHSTLCMNLLLNLRQRYGDQPIEASRALEERLRTTWEHLGADPYALVSLPRGPTRPAEARPLEVRSTGT